MNDTARRARTATCLLVALAVGATGVLLPVPVVATEAAMRVDTVVPPAELSAAGADASVAALRLPEVAPFHMVGASWEGAGEAQARIRVRTGADWGPWNELQVEDDDAPDAGSAENRNPRTVTRPLWVRSATGFEVEAPRAALQIHLVRENGSRVRLRPGLEAGAAQVPPVHDRASWGAQRPRSEPKVASSLRMGFVHHTAGSNAYGPDEVPRVLRSDQAYHMQARGWDDIGYNFLVDRFGRIWEGRAGGTDRPVIGAHTSGFNTGSTGVAVLGTFTSASVPAAALDGVARVLGWKLAIHGVDPGATTTMTYGGNDQYPTGTTVAFHTVSGHRDGKATECPGARLYERLPDIRASARAYAAWSPSPPAAAPPPRTASASRPSTPPPSTRRSTCRQVRRGRTVRCVRPARARSKARVTKPRRAAQPRRAVKPRRARR